MQPPTLCIFPSFQRVSRRGAPSDAGFTLIEMLFAIVIFTIMVSVLYPVFAEALHSSQETATQARLEELAKGTRVAYAKDAMVADTTGANGALVFTSDYSQYLGKEINTTSLGSGTVNVTPTQAYTPGNPQSIQTGFYAIAGASGNSPIHLATDGFGQPVWVYVSPEMQAQYDGYTLYFHDVGFLSTNGLPSSITPQSQGVTYTCTANPATEHYGCAFHLGTTDGAQHDLVSQVSGYAIESHMYKVTLDRMKKVADAYGSYFTTQYLANASRDEDIDYFAGPDTAWDGCGPPNGSSTPDGNNYMDSQSGSIPNTGNGSSNGPGYEFPGQNPDGSTVTYYGTDNLNDTQPAATFDGGAFIQDLGLSVSSVTTGWGFQMGVANGPNAPSFNNILDRTPLSCTPNLENPPFTAFILAWAPGQVLLSEPVVGNY